MCVCVFYTHTSRTGICCAMRDDRAAREGSTEDALPVVWPGHASTDFELSIIPSTRHYNDNDHNNHQRTPDAAHQRWVRVRLCTGALRQLGKLLTNNAHDAHTDEQIWGMRGSPFAPFPYMLSAKNVLLYLHSVPHTNNVAREFIPKKKKV